MRRACLLPVWLSCLVAAWKLSGRVQSLCQACSMALRMSQYAYWWSAYCGRQCSSMSFMALASKWLRPAASTNSAASRSSCAVDSSSDAAEAEERDEAEADEAEDDCDDTDSPPSLS